MAWATVSSVNENFEDAWSDVRADIRERLPHTVQSLLIFVVGHPRSVAHRLVRYVRASFPQATFGGGVVRGVVLDGRVRTNEPLIVAWAVEEDAQRPIVVLPLSASMVAMHGALQSWPWRIAGAMAFLEPAHVDSEEFLDHWRQVCPGIPIVGGTVQHEEDVTHATMWTHDGVCHEGGFLVLMAGAYTMRVAIAQGVRPIGEPMIVMKKRGTVVHEVDTGSPAQALLAALEDQHLLNEDGLQRLRIGVDVANEPLRTTPRDYVMHAFLGVDVENGPFAVDRNLQSYQSLRFYVRDATLAQRQTTAMMRRLYDTSGIADRSAFFAFVSHERDDNIAPDGSDAQSPTFGIACVNEIGPSGLHSAVHTGSIVVAAVTGNA